MPIGPGVAAWITSTSLSLAPVQKLEHRRHEERELLVDVEAEAVEGIERPRGVGLLAPLAAAGDHGERPVLRDGEGDERLKHRRHAVDLLDRVGEHRDVRLGRRRPRIERAPGRRARGGRRAAWMRWRASEVAARRYGAISVWAWPSVFQVSSDSLVKPLPRSSLKLSRTVRSQVVSAIAARRSWRSPPLDQRAAADDLGGAARGRPAQGPLASPGRVDRQADEASGELPAALALEHRPGDARAHAAAHQRARQPVARVAVAAVKEQADRRVRSLGRRALRAAQRRLALQQRAERVGLAGPEPDLRVRAADVEAAVVVGAGDGADGTRRRARGRTSRPVAG